MAYACPHKNSRKATKLCSKDAESVRGWKKHMTRNHGGYDESQLAAIVGAVAPDAERGRSLFLSEADGPVEVLPGQEPRPYFVSGEKTASVIQEVPAPEPMKRVPFKSKKLKKFFSSIPQVFLKTKGIEPDEDDKELIDTATEMVEEMFGVAFEVPEDMWVIRSRWLALFFPIGAIIIVWAKHALPDFLKAQLAKQQETKEEAAQTASAD